MSKNIVAAVVLFASVMLVGCQEEIAPGETNGKAYPLKISFHNRAGADAMVLNKPYTNPHGEDIEFTIFKYYISNLSLETEAGNTVNLPGTYFLVNQADSTSGNIIVDVPANKYKSLRYWFGVDSARNVSGVQSGALDPANAMFWTWNTGYIMAKMEAVSSVSTAPLSAVTYHIGGFKTGENVLRQITLSLPTSVAVQPSDTSEVVINADAMKWFTGAHEIKIADNPFCMNPGALALQIADNYANMFSVAAVKN